MENNGPNLESAGIMIVLIMILFGMSVYSISQSVGTEEGRVGLEELDKRLVNFTSENKFKDYIDTVKPIYGFFKESYDESKLKEELSNIQDGSLDKTLEKTLVMYSYNIVTSLYVMIINCILVIVFGFLAFWNRKKSGILPVISPLQFEYGKVMFWNGMIITFGFIVNNVYYDTDSMLYVLGVVGAISLLKVVFRFRYDYIILPLYVALIIFYGPWTVFLTSICLCSGTYFITRNWPSGS